jgi:hypothetical protein
MHFTSTLFDGCFQGASNAKQFGKINTFYKGFKSPPFKAIFHVGLSGLRSPGIYAWEDVTHSTKCMSKIIYVGT